jgi:hypothetical protein
MYMSLSLHCSNCVNLLEHKPVAEYYDGHSLIIVKCREQLKQADSARKAERGPPTLAAISKCDTRPSPTTYVLASAAAPSGGGAGLGRDRYPGGRCGAVEGAWLTKASDARGRVAAPGT